MEQKNIKKNITKTTSCEASGKSNMMWNDFILNDKKTEHINCVYGIVS